MSTRPEETVSRNEGESTEGKAVRDGWYPREPTRSSHHGLRFAPHKRELTHKQPTTGLKHVPGPRREQPPRAHLLCSPSRPVLTSRLNPPTPPSRFVRLSGFALLDRVREFNAERVDHPRFDDVLRSRPTLISASARATELLSSRRRLT